MKGTGGPVFGPALLLSASLRDVDDGLRAALAALTPSTRDLLRRVLVRDEGERGAASMLFFGEGGDGDYLIDDLIYAINRQTLDSDERGRVVQLLDDIDAEG